MLKQELISSWDSERERVFTTTSYM